MDDYAEGTLKVPEAEAFTGLGRTSLYALMESGALPHTKIGSRRLIPKRALIRLLSEGRETTTEGKKPKSRKTRGKKLATA
jgi:excisionase family DNA binding protein